MRDDAPSSKAERTLLAIDSVEHVWQQQVRAGIEGELTGLRFTLVGARGARVHVRVRPGCGWSRAPAAFETEVVASGGEERVFVDTSLARMPLAPSARFVVELAGTGSPISVVAEHTDAPFGDATRGEPLFRSAQRAFDDGGWRIALETFASAGDVTDFCFGRTCPCENDEPQAGCLNSSGTGARLYDVGGSTSVARDDLKLFAAALPPRTSGVLFAGSEQTRSPFGDGLRCTGGLTRVLAVGASSARGAIPFDHVASRSGGLITPGSTWILQTWYRDPQGPCGGAANLSNALSVVFRP